MVNQDGTTYIGHRLSPRMLGQRDAGRGQPSPPLYTSRAQAADYAAGWYECSARPAPDTLHPGGGGSACDGYGGRSERDQSRSHSPTSRQSSRPVNPVSPTILEGSLTSQSRGPSAVAWIFAHLAGTTFAVLLVGGRLGGGSG